MRDHEKKSFLYAASAVLLWSTVATAFKLTLEGMSFAQLLFFASLTSFITLFLIAYFTEKEKLRNFFSPATIKKNLLLGFINPFLYYLVLFKAYSLLPAQEAQPLNYTWPIMISLFAVLFLKEKFKLKTLIGLLLAFSGVVIISTRGHIFPLRFHDLYGVLLAFGSSIIWATFWILSLLDERDAVIKLTGSFFYGVIYAFVYILFFEKFKVENISSLFGAVYTGLFEMGLTFFLWLKALELSTDKGKTSTLAYFSPFLSVLFIAFVLKETILPSSIVGLVLIVGGVIYQRVGAGNSSLASEKKNN